MLKVGDEVIVKLADNEDLGDIMDFHNRLGVIIEMPEDHGLIRVELNIPEDKARLNLLYFKESELIDIG